MKYYIGVDLGGTNVRVAKVDEEGKILKDIIQPSKAKEGPEVVCDNIISILRQHDLSDVQGIGLAIPGPVDSLRNVITMATNMPGAEGYPFAERIENEFNLPVILDNDANAAGLAEAMLGAGYGYSTVYYLTHSTGIGGALIIDQRIHSGHLGYAGEVANVIVDSTAKIYPRYTHLNRGGVETTASGTAIGLIGNDVFGEKGNSSRKVFDLARQENKQALAILDKMSKDIATCMSDISAICAPDCFVIGGGCSKSHELYFDMIRKYYYAMAHSAMKDVPIRLAKLEEPGVVGAAMLVRARER